jgi:hypothetical protein
VMSTSVYTGLNPLILFANTFCRSAFGKSLCTYKSCWKWCPRASIQTWTRLILFANTFCRSAFGKSLCDYKICWKWCPRVSVQAWTRLLCYILCEGVQFFSDRFVRWCKPDIFLLRPLPNDFDELRSMESEKSINYISLSLTLDLRTVA